MYGKKAKRRRRRKIYNFFSFRFETTKKKRRKKCLLCSSQAVIIYLILWGPLLSRFSCISLPFFAVRTFFMHKYSQMNFTTEKNVGRQFRSFLSLIKIRQTYLFMCTHRLILRLYYFCQFHWVRYSMFTSPYAVAALFHFFSFFFIKKDTKDYIIFALEQ